MKEKKLNPKLERVLALVDPGRREAMRKVLLAAAYTAPAVSSFSLDALAQTSPTCFAANQTGLQVNFSGTVNCVGFSVANGGPDLVPQSVRLTFDVELELCEGNQGSDMGLISGGPTTLVTPNPVPVVAHEFAGKNRDTVGFSVSDVTVPGYHETGQWTHTVDTFGTEKLKGTSFVLVTMPGNAGISHTLECVYDLSSV